MTTATKYPHLTMDEDGNKTVTHQPIDNVDLELSQQDKGEK